MDEMVDYVIKSTLIMDITSCVNKNQLKKKAIEGLRSTQQLMICFYFAFDIVTLL